jgi:Tfp pilus assembly protein PilF
MAEGEIFKALALNEKNEWAYLHLGDIYRESGMCEAATEAYGRALMIAPEFELAYEHQQLACEGVEH